MLPEYQVGFEAVRLDASNNKLVTRLFLYRVTLQMGGKLEFSKKAAAGIPLKITALADTTKTAGEQIGEFQKRDGVEDELTDDRNHVGWQ